MVKKLIIILCCITVFSCAKKRGAHSFDADITGMRSSEVPSNINSEVPIVFATKDLPEVCAIITCTSTNMGFFVEGYQNLIGSGDEETGLSLLFLKDGFEINDNLITNPGGVEVGSWEPNGGSFLVTNPDAIVNYAFKVKTSYKNELSHTISSPDKHNEASHLHTPLKTPESQVLQKPGQP